MNERRRFLKMVAAGPAGAVLLPLFSQTGANTMAADCETTAECLGRLPENIIYTKERQGVWKGKSGGHVPVVEFEETDGGIKLDVETQHGMSEEHYIVRHTIVNGLGEVVGAKTFHWKDEPNSSFEIKLSESCAKSKDLYVMSYCNLHDLWLLQTKVDCKKA